MDSVRDRRDEVRGDLEAVELADMRLDVACSLLKRTGYDFLVETG